MKRRLIRLAPLIAALVHAPVAAAQIAVSADDGKARPADAPDAPRTRDSIAVLAIGHTVRILATLPVPASLVGPPGSVALSSDGRTAIVTAGQVLGPDGSVAPGDVVTVVDLSHPAAPRVVQTLRAGMGAAGVAISPGGALALVADTADATIALFKIERGRLTPAGTVALPAGSRPVDVAFADPGTAYVAAQGADALIRLAVAGARVTIAAAPIPVGAGPYSLAIDRRTQTAYVSHLGGRAPTPGPGPKPGSIGVVDLAAGRMVDQVDTGATPEHVGLSPSGRYLEATVANGSTAAPTSPGFHDHGIMTIYHVTDRRLTRAAETRTGRWCQGAAWRSDERLILLQCSLDRRIETYRFDGAALIPAAPVRLDARPAAIATPGGR